MRRTILRLPPRASLSVPPTSGVANVSVRIERAFSALIHLPGVAERPAEFDTRNRDWSVMDRSHSRTNPIVPSKRDRSRATEPDNACADARARLENERQFCQSEPKFDENGVDPGVRLRKPVRV